MFNPKVSTKFLKPDVIVPPDVLMSNFIRQGLPIPNLLFATHDGRDAQNSLGSWNNGVITGCNTGFTRAGIGLLPGNTSNYVTFPTNRLPSVFTLATVVVLTSFTGFWSICGMVQMGGSYDCMLYNSDGGSLKWYYTIGSQLTMTDGGAKPNPPLNVPCVLIVSRAANGDLNTWCNGNRVSTTGISASPSNYDFVIGSNGGTVSGCTSLLTLATSDVWDNNDAQVFTRNWRELLTYQRKSYFFASSSTTNSYIQGVNSGTGIVNGLSTDNSASFRNRVIQGLTKGNINTIGSIPYNIASFRAKLIQGIQQGFLGVNGLSPQNVSNLRRRLIQGITKGDILVNGLSPNNLYTSMQGVNQYFQGVLRGVINTTGLTPEQLKQAVVNRLQGIQIGSALITGLTPQDLQRASIPYISGVTPGKLQIVGFDVGNGYSGIAIGGGSAAKRLGLFSDAGVWDLPLKPYMGKFSKIDLRPKQDIAVDLSTEYAQLQLLQLQIQELEETWGKVSKTTALLQAKAELKQQKRKVAKLRQEYLLSEDEEILLLLL